MTKTIDYFFSITSPWTYLGGERLIEIAGRHDLSGTGFDSLGFGVQYQQAIGRHAQVTLESFYTINENLDDGLGARAEIQFIY